MSLTMKKSLLLLSIFSFAQNLNAQIDIAWEKHFGGTSFDVGYSVVASPDGGFVAAGYSKSDDGQVEANQGDNDYWVIKTDANGELIWQNDLGGIDNDICFVVVNANGGGYMLMGTSESNNGDVSGHHSPGLGDYWLVKLDEDGILLWSHCYGGLGFDNGRSIIATSDGGYAMVGESNSDDGDVTGLFAGQDLWIVKIDADGVIEWQGAHGGASNEYGYGIVQTDDGGFAVASASYSWDSGVVTGNHGSSDFWITRFDDAGVMLWQKSFGSTGADIPKSIAKCSNGDFVICGSSGNNDGDVTGFHGTYDYWVIRVSDDGELIWQKSLGGYDDEKANSIAATSDDGFIVTGFAWNVDGDVTFNHGGHDVWVVKLDASGNMVWEKSFGGTAEEEGYSIQELNPTEYILLGQTPSDDGDAISTPEGLNDFWLMKLVLSDNMAVNNKEEFKLQFTPNPFLTETRCTIKGNLNALDKPVITIIDISGKVVYSQGISSQSFVIDRKSLSAGVYQFLLHSNDGDLVIGKLVME